MKDIQFNPNDLTVKAGQTVTFTNDESVPHDVHKESGPAATSPPVRDGGMQQGDTFKQKLDKPGTYKYVCHVHPRHGRHDHRQVAGRRRTPKPLSSSRAVSPIPPRAGSRPSCVAAS